MSDLKRLVSSTGVYALAGLAQQGVGFLLIPVYTRLIDPAEYGVVEVLNAFASVAFACLAIGLSSAINKCFHRDCETPAEQRTVLPTAVLLDLPVLLAAGLTLVIGAGPISRWLVGTGGAEGLLILVVASSLCSTLAALALAGLRAQERAVAFSLLTAGQFVAALGLNLLLVVHYGLGIRGILWGNLLSNLAQLPVALLVATRGTALRFNPRLVRPLLTFGLYLIPVMLAGWVMDLSDRYFLRLYRDLGEVAVYGIGYKFGMLVQVAIVWPFQLAWPAFSFAISRQPGHQETYARTLTYLTAVLVFVVLGLSVLAPVALTVVVGRAYQDAYRVIPLVALAYTFNGIYYCLSPGVHIVGRTHYFLGLALFSAATNLVLNFLLIPRFGMMGAAWSTALAFLLLAVLTGVVAQRFYPVRYEYARIAKVSMAGALVYIATTSVRPETPGLSIVWCLGMAGIAFPALLLVTGFVDQRERGLLGGLFRRYVPLAG